MKPRVLVTGGAGYVGSHCARLLHQEGFEVVTLDNLSSGHPEAVSGELICGDLRDRDLVDDVLKTGFDAVLHFAARMSVGESVEDPLGYYDCNVGGTLSLLSAMSRRQCRRLIFSSTAAVYGIPDTVPISETTPMAPINPYGETKVVVEQLLHHCREQSSIQSICLRYFNAAGASEDGWIGEAHAPETHLIPIALEAIKNGTPISIFGTDFPTRDGTCLRDYIHVLDLAKAHLSALKALLDDKPGGVYNLGSQTGHSVREVISAIERTTGLSMNIIEGPRREGDPPALIADAAQAQQHLGWSAQQGLDSIIEHAWQWFQNPRFGPRS